MEGDFSDDNDLAMPDADDWPCAPEPFVVEWRRFWAQGLDPEEPMVEQVVEGASVRIREDASGQFKEDGKPARTLPAGTGTLLRRDGSIATVKFGNRTLLCEVTDLEFAPEDGGLQIGCCVRVRPGVATPTYGWGPVKPESVGVVIGLDGLTVKVRFHHHPNWKGRADEMMVVDDSGSSPTLDLRVRATYPICGGILADKIGYGKTATTIGLIDTTLDRETPPIPQVDAGSFIPAKGTLVVVPANLLDQWLNEFGKFLWESKSLKAKQTKGWSPPGCPLRIFAMSNVKPLTNVTAADLAQADVVLCSYRLLFSSIYLTRRKELAEGSTSLSVLTRAVKRLIEGEGCMKSGRKGADSVSRWEDLQFPVLEMFYWKRVVFDEFHELESLDSLQQNSLQHLRSHFRWGLTGTPPVDCAAGAIFMSSLFRMDLPGFLCDGLSTGPNEYPDLIPWEADRLLAESSRRWLDHYVRQNTAELPHIRLEEHVLVVHHTAEERALYLGQAHDAPDISSEDAFKSDENVAALQRLLKLCSHFQAAGDRDRATNAREECHRIGEQKERRLVKAKNQISRCSRVIKLLENKLGLAATGSHPWRKELVEAKERVAREGPAGEGVAVFFDAAEKDVAVESPEARLEVLDAHKPRDAELLGLMGNIDKKRGYADAWVGIVQHPLDAATLRRLLSAQSKEQAHNLKECSEAHTSLQFFRRTVAAMAADDSPATRSCSVCLEEGLPLTKLAITPCAHTFCLDCLTATIKTFHTCSICRQPLTAKDAQPLSAEVPAASSNGTELSGTSLSTPASSSFSASSSSTAPAAGANGAHASSSSTAPAADQERFGKFGTKLGALVKHLQALRTEDPTAKVILFVQFDDLKKKVADALREFGVPTVQLMGSVAHRAKVIQDWQDNSSSATFVLLLSLAQSASGTNLTAANHVVFLHPMLASTPERAVGHELQAIGRARRHGQRRDAVHVWRFVTADTIEQSITERNKAAMLSREEARVAEVADIKTSIVQRAGDEEEETACEA